MCLQTKSVESYFDNKLHTIGVLAQSLKSYSPEITEFDSDGAVLGINADYQRIMKILSDAAAISDFTRMRYVLISDDNTQNGWTIASDDYASFPNSTAINISSLE